MTYHLQIVTPDGLHFDGQAERLLAPAMEGQVQILARHINFVTPLTAGVAKVTTADGERYGACSGGMLAVTGDQVKVVAAAFEWADQIDTQRALASKERAEALLARFDLDRQTRQSAEARLKRANVRLAAAKKAQEL